MRYPLKQQGFTLYMVLVLMAIIAILVLAGGQTLNTEMRISTNDADRKFAFSLAEDALKAGELDAFTNVHKDRVLKDPSVEAALLGGNPSAANFFNATIVGGIFKDECDDGLCTAAIEKAPNDSQPVPDKRKEQAWERTIDGSSENVILANGRTYNVGNSLPRQPRYIIEFLGPAEDGYSTLYRITARAWGRNQSTQVTLQSIIRADNEI